MKTNMRITVGCLTILVVGLVLWLAIWWMPRPETLPAPEPHNQLSPPWTPRGWHVGLWGRPGFAIHERDVHHAPCLRLAEQPAPSLCGGLVR